MTSPRQYLLVHKRCRRFSAPVDLRSDFSRVYTSDQSEDESRRSKMSIIDLSVLFEGQSGSDSSLELDTSISMSREVSPVPCSTQPTGCYDCHRSPERESSCPMLGNWAIWKIVLTAQMMSICISVIDVTIKKMMSVKHPPSVSVEVLPHYIYLGLAWTPQLALREGSRGIAQVLRLSGLRYIFLAALHVEATTAAISSLRHDSYIGNQMIDCVAALLSFMIAYVCLEVEFTQTHVTGFAIAFGGAIGMCAANTNQPSKDDDVTWGDVLRFGSGIFLSLNSIAQELIVKSIDTVEYLGMIGLIGSIICGIQAIALDENLPLPTSCDYWMSLAVFSLVQFIFCCLAPKTLRDVGATGMHLALMTSNFYNQFFEYLFKGNMGLFFISYVLIIGGSFIFTLKRTSIGKHYFYPVQVTLSRHDS